MCARGAVPLSPAEAFFTNVAQHILHTMATDFAPVTNVNTIMVWPTNLYGNGIHRVMQQAANLYEATRSNAFPSVFRPLFGNLGTTNRFIVGWTNDNDASTLPAWLDSNSNGVPLVVAAKRGLPNFNEFMLRTDVSVERRLQLTRPAADQRPDRTNQMFVVSLSNLLALESWNAWSTPFNEPSTIEVTNLLTVTVHNAAGVQSQAQFGFATVTNLLWWTNRSPSDEAFVVPMDADTATLSNAVFRFANNQFDTSSSTNIFEDLSGSAAPFPVPQWNVTVSNFLVYTHRAGTNLLDVVVLQDAHAADLSRLIATQAISPQTVLGNVWSTNRAFGPSGPTEGLRAQIQFSQSDAKVADWIPFSRTPTTQTDLTSAIRQFRDFLIGSTNSPNLVQQTPFNPIARFVRDATWQANDPLVHYHRDDLTARTPSVSIQPVKWNETNLVAIGSSSIQRVNRAYAPWGEQSISSNPSAYDPRVRDPGVAAPDNWCFPTNQSVGSVTLGDIHRGTPWQTIYLKSSVASPFTAALTAAEWIQYANQTAVRDGKIVPLNHPTNDWELAAMLTDLFATNNLRKRLPVNTTNRAAWTATLTGISTLTNIVSDEDIFDPFHTWPEDQQFAPVQIESVSPQLPGLLDAIESRRRAQPGGYLPTVAALLDTPELSIDSPWLNRSEAQRFFGISDHAYEMLPNQLLARLRADPVINVKWAAPLLLEVQGCDGCAYDLYASTDAQSWSRISGPHLVAEGRIVIPVEPQGSQRFFRVRELP